VSGQPLSDDDYEPEVMVDCGRADANSQAEPSPKPCRTRRDFRKQRRDAENRFINRRAEVVMDTGEVRNGNDKFLVRVTFDDNYWVLRDPDNDNVRILPPGKEAALIAMSE